MKAEIIIDLMKMREKVIKGQEEIEKNITARQDETECKVEALDRRIKEDTRVLDKKLKKILKCVITNSWIKYKIFNLKINKEHGSQNINVNIDIKETAARMKLFTFEGKKSWPNYLNS